MKTRFYEKYFLTMIPEIVSWILILLFLHTAVDKLADFKGFISQMKKSPLIEFYAKPLGIAVPLSEAVTALLLVFNRARLVGLYFSVFLMSAFTAYIYAMLRYSYHLDCSCGGVTKYLNWPQHLWFNATVLSFSILAVVLSKRQKTKAGHLKE